MPWTISGLISTVVILKKVRSITQIVFISRVESKWNFHGRTSVTSARFPSSDISKIPSLASVNNNNKASPPYAYSVFYSDETNTGLTSGDSRHHGRRYEAAN